MKVFKTILKIVKSYKAPIILYTCLLIAFGGINFATENNSESYVASKPRIYIINNDEETKLNKDFISYLDQVSEIVSLKDEDESLNDALFYRDISCIVSIPKNFSKDIISGTNPEIEIKQAGDYSATLATNLISKYIKLANIYVQSTSSEEELINKINETLDTEVAVNIETKLDVNSLSRVSRYFCFLNYCLLAGCVYVICLVLSTFHKENVNKRNLISSTSYRKINFELLLSTGLLAILFWAFYMLLAIILLGSIMFTIQGLLYMLNSLIFTICSLSIALLIGNLINNKNAINGIINVVALGSSFLCGCFVPSELLPDSVITISKILPSYWYTNSNNLLITLDEINLTTLSPYFKNLCVIIAFTIIFIIINNIVTRLKRKIA